MSIRIDDDSLTMHSLEKLNKMSEEKNNNKSVHRCDNMDGPRGYYAT